MTAKILSISDMKAKQEKEDSGEWYTYDEGGKFLVAFIGREDFAKKLNRLEDSIRQSRPDLKKKDGRQNYVKKLPPEMSEEIGFKAMYGTLILDWDNIDPAYSEFTEVNFVTVLKAVRGLGNALLEFSSERENFHREQIEDNAGN